MPPHRCRRRRHAHVLGRPPYWDTQAYLVEQPPPHSSRMRISTRHRNLQIHGCCTDRMNSPGNPRNSFTFEEDVDTQPAAPEVVRRLHEPRPAAWRPGLARCHHARRVTTPNP